MTKEELVNRYKLIKLQDSLAYQRIWNIVKGMVKIVYYHDPTDLNLIEDFEQISRIGLLKAIKSYKGEKKASFRTWAKRLMHQEIVNRIIKPMNTKRRFQEGMIKVSVEEQEVNLNKSTSLVYDLLVKAARDEFGDGSIPVKILDLKYSGYSIFQISKLMPVPKEKIEEILEKLERFSYDFFEFSF